MNRLLKTRRRPFERGGARLRARSLLDGEGKDKTPRGRAQGAEASPFSLAASSSHCRNVASLAWCSSLLRHDTKCVSRSNRRRRINSLGNLAGFVSPYVIGWIIDKTHSTDLGVYTLAACLTLGGLLVLALPKRLVDR